jgi:hypothetical protein
MGVEFISCNSVKFGETFYCTVSKNSVEFRRILYRVVYTEFRIPSNENSSIKKLKKSTKEMEYAVEFRRIHERFM